jgi:2-iminobutanoate/2-iminopropanoate deaminase
VVQGGFEAQARQVFRDLRTVLEQAGGSLEDVVKLTVYLTDMSQLHEYGRIRAEYMPGAPLSVNGPRRDGSRAAGNDDRS